MGEREEVRNKTLDAFDFIQMSGFADEWERLRLEDEDLRRLEMAIMARPKGNPVIPGTGGLRKMRFSPPGMGKGKRGAFRVCYVYFEEVKVVILVIVYSKREYHNLTPAGRKTIKQLISRQRNEFSKRKKQ